MSGFWDVVGWGSGWFTRYINSHMIFRDNVKLYFGDGKDTSLYWDGTNFYIDTTSGGVYIQDQIYAATHLHFGDADKLYFGASDDVNIQYIATDEWQFSGAGWWLYDAATTANKFLKADAGTTTANVLTIASGSALTSGIEIASGAGGIVLDSAAGFTLEAGGTSDFTVKAQTHYFYDLAGTSTEFISIDIETTTANVATIASGAAVTAGIEIAPGAGDINLDSPAGIILDMTSVSSLAWAGVTGLKVDDGAIAAWAYTADTDGPDILFSTASGGAHTSNDPDGGDFIVQPGAKGAGGSGAVGRFKVKDPGSADSVDFHHSGTAGVLNCTHYLLSNNDIRMLDLIDFCFGTNASWCLRNNSASPTHHLELKEDGVPALAFYGSTIVAQGFAAVADTAGNDIFIATQTAGAHTSNNPRGGNLAFELGTGTGTGVQGTLSVNGPVSITPATTIVGLAVDMMANDDHAISINTEAANSWGIRATVKHGIYMTQDVSGGRAAYINRDLAEAGTYPLIALVDDNAANTQHTLSIQQDSTTVTTAAAQLLRNGLTTTSTDGLLIENSTAAQVGVTVEMSPRIRLRGHAWKSDATAASETQDWIIENLPATGAANTTSTLKFGWSDNGAAYVYRMTLASDGTLEAPGVSGSSWIRSDTIYSSANDATLALQARNFTGTDSAIEACGGTATLGAGETYVGLMVKPTHVGSGTAAASDLVVSRTETSVGSGAQLLADFGTTTDGTYANHTSLLNVSNTGSLFMKEKASADADTAAYGQLWIKTATPNHLYFTDDAGTDHEVGLFSAEYGEMIVTAQTVATIETASTPHAMVAWATGAVADWTFTAGITGAITAYADYSGTVAGTVKATCVGHGLTTGDFITIRGTTNYNGVFEITTIDSDEFYFTDTWVADDGASDFEMGDYLTPNAGVEGDYHITWQISGSEGGGAGGTFHFRVYADATEATKLTTQRKFSNNDVGSMGGTAIITVAASDRIWMALESDGTNDLTIEHANINLHRV